MNKPEAGSIGLVERAKALAPLILAEADEIERTRRLTPKLVSALIENGLYRSLLPRSIGAGYQGSKGIGSLGSSRQSQAASPDAASPDKDEKTHPANQMNSFVRSHRAPAPTLGLHLLDRARRRANRDHPLHRNGYRSARPHR